MGAARDVRRGGLTLLELLVVIAIIAALMALSLPAVQRSRESARAMLCKNRMRQVGIALHSFESQNQKMPAGNDISSRFSHSWFTRILPMIDQASLYQRYDWSQRWDDAKGATGLTNNIVTATTVPLFVCPSTPTLLQGACDYGGNYGTTQTGLPAGFRIGDGWEAGALLVINSSGKSSRTSASRLGEFHDGLSQVILVYESAGRSSESGHWGAGTNCFGIEYPVNGNADGETIMSFHLAGGHVLFADGHVTFVSNNADLNLLARLATRNGNEPIESAF